MSSLRLEIHSVMLVFSSPLVNCCPSTFSLTSCLDSGLWDCFLLGLGLYVIACCKGFWFSDCFVHGLWNILLFPAWALDSLFVSCMGSEFVLDGFRILCSWILFRWRFWFSGKEFPVPMLSFNFYFVILELSTGFIIFPLIIIISWILRTPFIIYN